MAQEKNPFLGYLNTHPGADAAALKQLFRMLAKRTHPDLGAENEADFVRLQEAYNEAIAHLLGREHGQQRGREHAARSGATADNGSVWFPSSPREQVLHFLYRYKAMLPSMTLEPLDLPPACRRAFTNAMDASAHYTDECRYALEQFDEQFHDHRREINRFPEVSSKYRFVVQSLAAFFDYCTIPNRLNRRLTLSYLKEIKPVTDFDPNGPPELRTNRSAAARSAMYRMRVWLESELDAGACRII